jgi:hypothetical protein
LLAIRQQVSSIDNHLESLVLLLILVNWLMHCNCKIRSDQRLICDLEGIKHYKYMIWLVLLHGSINNLLVLNACVIMRRERC